MILADSRILEEKKKGTIVIKPFHKACLGSNSYDVHLGEWIAEYEKPEDGIFDAKKPLKLRYIKIPKDGFVFMPGRFYLGLTYEYTETHAPYVPFLEGKSSTGRLSIKIHDTAGKGDVGFCNTWTLEITVTEPVRVYYRMPIGQLIYHLVEGEVLNPYGTKQGQKYNAESYKKRNRRPVESRMWKNYGKDPVWK